MFTSELTNLTPLTTYYVRAYASNTAGTVYGDEVTFTTNYPSWPCTGLETITVNHFAGLVAPVAKTVTYSTVTNIPGVPSRCWITSNLGADRQATSVYDDTEASAGWYWQFNRKQGYKNDGSGATPSWTISTISEAPDWEVANDPCSLELGADWRIPTDTEWNNAVAGGSWTNWIGPWNSGLKIHAAGYLSNVDGLLVSRGEVGQYWSRNKNSYTYGWSLYNNINVSFVWWSLKASGLPLRCVK